MCAVDVSILRIVNHVTMLVMDEAIKDILHELEDREYLDTKELDRIIRRHCKRHHDGKRSIAKKSLLPYYLEVKRDDPQKYSSWNVSDELEARFMRTMKMKPRRTASGVATITVITKPWPCSGDCIYCPCDIRMPKSYLHDEPACQRAERNFFDPYLQVASRLRALQHMGHATDKVELIVLGGSWSDYPAAYRIWFVSELFRALNDDADTREEEVSERIVRLEKAGLNRDAETLDLLSQALQKRIDAGEISFNDAFAELYGNSDAWSNVAEWQRTDLDSLFEQQRANESSEHRVVGLVIETRPATISCEELTSLRMLGCTKIQIGIQSLDEGVLAANGRPSSVSEIASALSLCRLFGFKTHVHFMLNLYSSTPDRDKADYRKLVSDPRFLPDEVKLYPCALVQGTRLVNLYKQGLWAPYTEQELIDVLCEDVDATPPYMRVSRMIRDISAKDILVGNKKTNLRQLVEMHLNERANSVQEIRFREIGTSEVDLEALQLHTTSYDTSTTNEHFIEWRTPENKIAGFLRLSLPQPQAIQALGDKSPVNRDDAMIREVHVYGFAAKLSHDNGTAQHKGLGRNLIDYACDLARVAGYKHMNVISAVGTREYYRKLGFVDNGLYQTRQL